MLAASLVLLVFLWADVEIRDSLLDRVCPTCFYNIGLTRYDFKPTPHEQACLDGNANRINALGMPTDIPKVVHFVTNLDRSNPITLLLWLAIRAAAANLPGCEIRLHHVHPFLDEDGPLWKDVRDIVTLTRHGPEYLDDFSHITPPPSQWSYAHKADILRLQILRAEGGIYLDSDAIVLRPLDKLLSGRRDVILGHEGGHRRGMANAVILAKPGAPFVERWYQAYNNFEPKHWNYHSVVLPARLADKHPDEICQLPPAAFFWPLWTQHHLEWMHTRLSQKESAAVAADMERTNGSLFDEQLIYHAWNHVAQKWLGDLTPERIWNEDTRFNMLVRRFVDPKFRFEYFDTRQWRASDFIRESRLQSGTH